MPVAVALLWASDGGSASLPFFDGGRNVRRRVLSWPD